MNVWLSLEIFGPDRNNMVELIGATPVCFWATSIICATCLVQVGI